MTLKAFRLFVSSTFSDFAQERELLQSKVFPALDAYCAAKGYQFHAVDLRWGVNEEAQLDQRTAEICLGEVVAAKRYPPPNFLIMVGDRYGWVPLPFAIAQDEFEAVRVWLAERGRTEAVRDLRKVYRLDENHLVPPGLAAAVGSGELIGAYTLRSREDEIPELDSADAWKKVEDELRHALQEVADHLAREGRISETAHAKYLLSLTEQEIIHGLLGYNLGVGNQAQSASAEPDAGGPQSIAWIREDAGVGGDPERRPSLLRRIVGLGSRLAADADPAVGRDPRVEKLKAGIRRALSPDCVLSGRAIRNGSRQPDEAYLEDFAARIESRLRATIDRHIALIEAQERSADAELVRERAQHRGFAEARRSVFFGRESNLAVIESYLAGDNPHPLVLFGPSGLGKSALMARAVAETEKAGGGVPVAYRFVGASAASADVRSLLVSIVEDLAAHGIASKPEQWENDAYKFDEQIRTLLLSIDRPAVAFIDALDQLKKPHRLGWLPDNLPPRLKIVVSALNDDAYREDGGVYRALRQRLPSEAFLGIEPLTQTQGCDILMALENKTQRRLRPGQRDYILGRFETAGASPLYLRVAFEIARGWRSWDETGQGRCVLAGDTAALIGQLIAELSSVHHHEPEFVSRTLGYLAAAKEGLSAKEMTEVLSRDDDVIAAISSERHGVQTRKLPDSVWVRLNRQLATLLAEKRVDEQPLLQFFHRQLSDMVRERHYAPAKAALHGALADYFDAGTGTAGKDAIASSEKTYAKRSLSELPYQLFHSERRANLDQILMAPDWMQQKLAAFGPEALVTDYDRFGRSEIQALIGRTLRLISGICARDKRQLLPQLVARLMRSAEPAAPKFLYDARRHLAKPAILTQRPSLAPAGAETARLASDLAVKSLAVLPDGRLVSGDGAGRRLGDVHAFYADQQIRLWDLQSGAEVARLGGHKGWINALVLLPDGRLASGSSDHTIRLWDLVRCAETAKLEGHTNTVHALSVLPDGRLASASWDHTIRLWDLQRCAEIDRLVVPTEVNALALLQDGRLASAGGPVDNTIQLWDLNRGVETARLEGHSSGVWSLAPLREGQLASGSYDKTIRLWDLQRCAEIARLEGHAGTVNALALLPDGRLASGSSDKTIRLWDLRRCREIGHLEGHNLFVHALLVLPDGRLASSSEDNTIRVWNPNSSPDLARFEGHTGSIEALAQLPSGGLASASSSDNTIRLWDPKSSSEIARVQGQDGCGFHALTLLPDGRLASGSWSTIRLWDLQSCTEISRLEGHTDWVRALALLPDGQLASGCDSRDMTIRLWDPNSGAMTGRLEGHTSGINALVPLADGRLASGSGDHTIRLWHVQRATEIARLEGHTDPVLALALLPDGRLVSGSIDKTVRLWDLERGSEAIRLDGHTGWVSALVLLPDGRLASGSWDHTIRLWDLERAVEIARIELDAEVSCLTAFRDGRLVAGDHLGRLHWLEIVD